MATGAIVLPFSLAMLLVSPRAGRLAARLGSRAPVLAGQCAQVLGLVGIAAGMAVGPIPVAIGVGVLGVGIALLSTPLTAVAMTAVPAERAGMASGIMSTQRAVGSTVGYAVLGAVLATWLGATLDADLAPVLRDPEQRTAVAEAVLDDATPAAYAAEIGPGRPIAAASGTERDAIRAAVDDDFVHGIQAGLGVAAVLALLVLVALVRGFPGRDREAAATTGADPPAEDR